MSESINEKNNENRVPEIDTGWAAFKLAKEVYAEGDTNSDNNNHGGMFGMGNQM